MSDTTLDGLISGLARFDRANRRWRGLATAAVLGLAVVFLTGQIPLRPALLEAEQVTIRDASGRARILIRSLETGAALLTFRDELERDRLALGVLDDGTPVLSLYDEHRRRRLAVGAFSPEVPGVHLYGREGTPRAALVLHSDGLAALEFNGQDGAPRGAVTLDGGDPPRMSILDGRTVPPVAAPPPRPR